MNKNFKLPGFAILLFVLSLSLVFTLQAVSQNGGEIRIKLFNPQPEPGSVASSKDLVISLNLTWEMFQGWNMNTFPGFNPPELKFVVDGVDVSEHVKIEPTPLAIFPPIFIIKYVPQEPLVPGEHSVEATVINIDGTATNLSWAFKIKQDGTETKIKLFNPQPKPDSVVSGKDLVISANLTWVMFSDILNAIEFKPPQIKFVMDNVDVSKQVKIELSPLDIYPPIYIISCVPQEPLKPGGHSAVVSAINSDGNATTLSWKFTVKRDEEKPISIGDFDPEPGSAVSLNVISISAYIRAKNGVDPNSVKMLVNDKPVIPRITRFELNSVVVKVSYNPEDTLIDGHHKVNIAAANYNGEAAKAEWRFTVDTTPPRITPLEPKPEQTVQHPQPLIKVELRETIAGGFIPPREYPILGGSGLDVESLAMYLDGNQVKPKVSGNIAADAPFELRHVEYRPVESLADGKHEVILKVKDQAGLSTSATWSFVVETQVPPPPPPDNTNAVVIGGAEYRITLNKFIYRQGEPIQMNLKVTNLVRCDLPFAFPSAQQYDFVVSRDGRLVWNWAHGMAFPEVIVRKILAPGESMMFRAKWDQKDNDKNPVATGKYEATGILTSITLPVPDRCEVDDATTTRNSEYILPPQPRVSVGFEIEGELPPPHNTNAIVYGGAEYRITLDKFKYNAGEPVAMSLKVTNLADCALEFFFSDGQQYDFVVAGADGRVVWNWAHGKGFPDMFMVKTLEPGESMAFHERWNQEDNTGRPVPHGKYTTTGILTTRQFPVPLDCDIAQPNPDEDSSLPPQPRVSVTFEIVGEIPIGETILGTVVTQDDSPVHGAIVELWQENNIATRGKTDERGKFVLKALKPAVYVLRVWKEGFFPHRMRVPHGIRMDENGDVRPPEGDLTIHLKPAPRVVATPYVVDFYGRKAGFEMAENRFNPVLPGDVITAIDPDGVVCGVFMVRTAGEYGFMHVYGDDETTNSDEGTKPGDNIIFRINGFLAKTIGPDEPIWTRNGAQQEVNLLARETPPKEIIIKLRKGWNLVAFSHLINSRLDNSDPDSPNRCVFATDFLGKLRGLTLARGFDRNGILTFDPNLPQFSDLKEIRADMGYWIQMKDDVELKAECEPMPIGMPIELAKGWNLIPYLPLQPLPIKVALASTEGLYEMVRGFESGTQIYAVALEEFSDLHTMLPHSGYWIKMREPAKLVYPVTYNPEDESTVVSDISEQNSSVTPSMYSTAFYGSVMLDGKPAPMNTIITAFDSAGNLIGEYAVEREGEYGFLHVYKETPENDAITFKVNGIETNTDREARWTTAGDIMGDITEINLSVSQSGIFYGDVSKDGSIDAYDASLILQSVVGLKELDSDEFERADVTNDGKVTAFDASLVLQRSVNLIDRFPAEGESNAPIMGLPASKGCALSLGDVFAKAGQRVPLAIRLSGEGVYAGSFSLSPARGEASFHDNTLLKIKGVTIVGPISKYILSHNIAPNTTTVAFASTEPIKQGIIANVEVEISANAKIGSVMSLDLENISINGVVSSSNVVAKPGSIQVLPKHTALLRNYPNPFNPETWIPFQLAESAEVTIRIYDITGRLVKTLHLGQKSPGVYIDQSKAAHWDGRNETGEFVSSGIYFYAMQSGKFSAAKKLAILK